MLSQILGQQPSVPSSEAGIMAGLPFRVDVTLKTKAAAIAKIPSYKI